MFCGKCGKEMDGNVRFCPHCGAENPNAARTGAPLETAQAVKPKLSNRTVGIAAVAAVAVVVVVILIIALAGGRSAKSTVGKFVDAATKPDAVELFKLLPSGLVIQNEEEVGESLNTQLEDVYSELDRFLGTPVKYTYEILSLDEVSDSKLETIQLQYKNVYGVNVKDAQIARVELTAKGTLHTKTATFSLPLIKVGGSWAVDYISMGNNLSFSFLNLLF